MYPAAMTLPRPNACVVVALPEENAARLSLDWAPPARMKVGKGLYGPHTADMAERLGLSPSPCEKLVPTCLSAAVFYTCELASLTGYCCGHCSTTTSPGDGAGAQGRHSLQGE